MGECAVNFVLRVCDTRRGAHHNGWQIRPQFRPRISARLKRRARHFPTLALRRHWDSVLASNPFTLLVCGFFLPLRRRTSALEDTERGRRAVRDISFYRAPFNLERFLACMWRKPARNVGRSGPVATPWASNVLDVCPYLRAEFARKGIGQNTVARLGRIDGVRVLCNLHASNGLARVLRKRRL